MFIIKSGINYNRAVLAKHFCDGFPKQVWIWSVQGHDGRSSVRRLWTARLFGYQILKILVCNNIYICPFVHGFILLWLSQDDWVPRRAVGAHGVAAAVPRCAGDVGAALAVTQRWPVPQERCPPWLPAHVCVFVDLHFVPLLPATLVVWTAASGDTAKSGYCISVTLSLFNDVVILKGRRLVRDSWGPIVCIVIKSHRNRSFFCLICFIFAWWWEFQVGRDTCFLLESLLSRGDEHWLLVFHWASCRLLCLANSGGGFQSRSVCVLMLNLGLWTLCQASVVIGGEGLIKNIHNIHSGSLQK